MDKERLKRTFQNVVGLKFIPLDWINNETIGGHFYLIFSSEQQAKEAVTSLNDLNEIHPIMAFIKQLSKSTAKFEINLHEVDLYLETKEVDCNERNLIDLEDEPDREHEILDIAYRDENGTHYFDETKFTPINLMINVILI